MASFSTDTGIITIGNPSITGANTRTTWGMQVADPPTPLSALFDNGPLDVRDIWKSQPSVRKVVEFAARNVAVIPWKIYSRAADDDRQRVSDSAAEQLLRSPNPGARQTSYNLLFKLTCDSMLYDRWCVALLPDSAGSMTLQRIPPRLLSINSDRTGNISQVGVNTSQGVFDLTGEPLAIGTGWSPIDGGGISPLVTLRQILQEQSNAVAWRNAQWDRSPKFTGIITRPLEAPDWDKAPEKQARFVQSWREFRDSNAGGTPILEDGMDYKSLGSTISPADANDIEGRRLSEIEVCSAFHIPPELVGSRQGTFSNIAAFRQMLYGPTLGPILEQFEQAFNLEIIPALDADGQGLYGELDRNAALNGSFLEMASYLQTAVGGPYMTRAEARTVLDYSKIPGTEQLIVPLNVTEGGLASPTDTGSQNRKAKESMVRSAARMRLRRNCLDQLATVKARSQTSLADALTGIYQRQLSEHDDKEDPKAFHRKWDAILAQAMSPHTWATALAGAKSVIDEYNPSEDGWAADVMRPYVDAITDNAASKINDGMLGSLEDLDDAEDEDEDDSDDSGEDPKKSLLDRLKDSTALAWAGALVANCAGFGRDDAASASGLTQKTWTVTSANPRPAHAAMNGETVGMRDTFSNGARWPGDGGLDVDESAGCTCVLSYTW
ncbi:MAG: phage portal protein [Bifidobacterium tibiigranuli]|jgi:HK97 family phage portal protein|uniref:phage portal protein n=1 Tax=Bifidobacterium tibiigranuli TaxID=2172043 RepID=UPI0026EE0645|nr:phage portal protein [Bifidobacterium tibiigranuli]MCI1673149.1 phage portal protein [Bifidobacterium tibiigranuli]MCI1713606.1 phage portal protein [Bifidobacterium tibiigranuli]